MNPLFAYWGTGVKRARGYGRQDEYTGGTKKDRTDGRDLVLEHPQRAVALALRSGCRSIDPPFAWRRLQGLRSRLDREEKVVDPSS